MKENRILLNESSFTSLVKKGFIIYDGIEVSLYKSDISNLCKGEIVEKIHTDWTGDIIFKLALQDIGFDVINEILKRSPLFNDLAGNFLN